MSETEIESLPCFNGIQEPKVNRTPNDHRLLLLPDTQPARFLCERSVGVLCWSALLEREDLSSGGSVCHLSEAAIEIRMTLDCQIQAWYLRHLEILNYL